MNPTNCLTCRCGMTNRDGRRTGPKDVHCCHADVGYFRDIAKVPGRTRKVPPPTWCPRKEETPQ